MEQRSFLYNDSEKRKYNWILNKSHVLICEMENIFLHSKYINWNKISCTHTQVGVFHLIVFICSMYVYTGVLYVCLYTLMSMSAECIYTCISFCLYVCICMSTCVVYVSVHVCFCIHTCVTDNTSKSSRGVYLEEQSLPWKRKSLQSSWF